MERHFVFIASIYMKLCILIESKYFYHFFNKYLFYMVFMYCQKFKADINSYLTLNYKYLLKDSQKEKMCLRNVISVSILRCTQKNVYVIVSVILLYITFNVKITAHT